MCVPEIEFWVDHYGVEAYSGFSLALQQITHFLEVFTQVQMNLEAHIPEKLIFM